MHLRQPLAILLVCAASGCEALSGQKLATLQSQNRALSEQNHSQLAEMENLKAHAHKLEDQVIEAEQTLARLDSQIGGDRRRLAITRGLPVSARLGDPLVELSRRYRSLRYDPASGISKLEVDILFDEGKTDLKPEAQKLLREFAGNFQGPEAAELRVIVVGHTDDQQMAKKPVREQYATNWHLSTARSVAVADFLRRLGVPEERMGVSAYAQHQPLVANSTPEQRHRNRRVEIYVTAADTRIVGWEEFAELH